MYLFPPFLRLAYTSNAIKSAIQGHARACHTQIRQSHQGGTGWTLSESAQQCCMPAACLHLAAALIASCPAPASWSAAPSRSPCCAWQPEGPATQRLAAAPRCRPPVLPGRQAWLPRQEPACAWGLQGGGAVKSGLAHCATCAFNLPLLSNECRPSLPPAAPLGSAGPSTNAARRGAPSPGAPADSSTTGASPSSSRSSGSNSPPSSSSPTASSSPGTNSEPPAV